MLKNLLFTIFLSTSLMAMDSDEERLSARQSDQTWLPDREMTKKESQDLEELLVHIHESKKEEVREIVTNYFEKNYRLLQFCQLDLTNEEFLEGVYPFIKKNPQIESLSLDGNDINIAFMDVEELAIPALSLRQTKIEAIHLIHLPKWKINILNLCFNYFSAGERKFLNSIKNIDLYLDEESREEGK